MNGKASPAMSHWTNMGPSGEIPADIIPPSGRGISFPILPGPSGNHLERPPSDILLHILFPNYFLFLPKTKFI